MICQACRIEAPTKYVEFHSNVGMLVMRQHRKIKGKLCKSCIHKNFWKFTGTCLLLGWWGMISLIVNPFFILNNVGRYLMCLSMPPVPPGAQPPVLTDQAIRKIQPRVKQIFQRLNDQEKLDDIAQNVGPQIGVTPGQVILYVLAASKQAKQQTVPGVGVSGAGAGIPGGTTGTGAGTGGGIPGSRA